MVFDTTRFEDCRFSDVQFNKVNFNHARFSSCSFSGKFASVNWVGCGTSEVDLTDVRMLDCSLVDSPDADIRLPDNDENFVATYGDFETVDQMVEERFSPSVHRSFRDAAEFVKSSEYGEILDVEFFEGISKTEARTLMSEFRGLLRSSELD